MIEKKYLFLRGLNDAETLLTSAGRSRDSPWCGDAGEDTGWTPAARGNEPGPSCRRWASTRWPQVWPTRSSGSSTSLLWNTTSEKLSWEKERKRESIHTATQRLNDTEAEWVEPGSEIKHCRRERELTGRLPALQMFQSVKRLDTETWCCMTTRCTHFTTVDTDIWAFLSVLWLHLFELSFILKIWQSAPYGHQK